MKWLLSFGLIPVYQEREAGEIPEKQSDQGLCLPVLATVTMTHSSMKAVYLYHSIYVVFQYGTKSW